MVETPPPDLEQTAWQRGRRDAAAVYGSATFGIAVALVELVAIPAAVLFTVGETSTQTQVAVPILSGALALVLAFLAVLAVQVAAAPFRQRNEARTRLRDFERRDPDNARLEDERREKEAERTRNERTTLRQAVHDVSMNSRP
jgi:hypothetical protein